MGFYSADVYNQPEKFGLEIVYEVDTAGSYEFNIFVVFKHDSGKFYWAQDAGCSCPCPFEDFTSIDDLTEVTDVASLVQELDDTAWHATTENAADLIDAMHRAGFRGPSIKLED